jgi:hypothetical protein
MLNPPKIALRASYLLFLIPLLGSFKCQKAKDAYYETISIDLTNADNSGTSPANAGDSVSRHAYALEIHLLLEAIIDNTGHGNYRYNQNEDVVTDFQILSSSDINGIPAYQSLNQLFLFRNKQGQYSDINSSTYTAVFSENYSKSNKEIQWNSSNFLMLMHPPSVAGDYTFYVSGTFSDGRILSDSVQVKLY